MADTSIWGPIIASLFGAIGQGVAGPSQQQRVSYSGTTADPVATLTQALNATKSFGSSMADQVSKGVHLRGYAPPVPGLKVSDPAASDPSVLDYPGMDLSGLSKLFGGSGALGSPQPPTFHRPGDDPAAPPASESPDGTVDPTATSGTNMPARPRRLNDQDASPSGGAAGTDSSPSYGQESNPLDVLSFISDPAGYTLKKVFRKKPAPTGTPNPEDTGSDKDNSNG